jgi:hypothetical protein
MLSVIDQSGIAAKGIGASNMHTGAVLQVVQSNMTAAWSSSATGSWVSTGLSVSIIPVSSTSKILVSINLATGQSTSAWGTFWGVQRNGANIGGGVSLYGAPSGCWVGTDAYGSDNQVYGLSQQYLDAPNSAGLLTYTVVNYGEGNTAYLNRSLNTGSGTSTTTGISSITLMEIAG